MKKNDQIYRFSDTATISSSAKKQFFVFQRNVILGKKTTSFVMGSGCAIFKKLISHFDLNVFLIAVWILLQLTAFVLKLQQKNLHGQKSTVWKTALILNIYLLECCLLY